MVYHNFAKDLLFNCSYNWPCHKKDWFVALKTLLEECLRTRHKEVWALRRIVKWEKVLWLLSIFTEIRSLNSQVQCTYTLLPWDHEKDNYFYVIIELFALRGRTLQTKKNLQTNTLRKSWSHSAEWQLVAPFAMCKIQLMASLTHSLVIAQLETTQFVSFAISSFLWTLPKLQEAGWCESSDQETGADHGVRMPSHKPAPPLDKQITVIIVSDRVFFVLVLYFETN